MIKDVTNNTLQNMMPVLTPAKIEFDFDAFDKEIEKALSTFSEFELSSENYKTIKENITTYKGLYDNLDTRRKEISNNFKKPLDDFKNRFDKSLKPLEELIDKLRDGRDAIDEHERLLRVDIVRATFEDKCMVAGLEKSTFEDRYDEYSFKKYFKTGKFELKKSTLDEMDALVLAEFDALEQYKANKQAIKEQAQEYDLPTDAYIRHLEDGKTLVDVLKIMKTDRDAIVSRKEQQEAQAKAEEERKAEIERIAKEKANAQIKAFNADTGEILESDPIPPEPQETTPEMAKFEPSEAVSYDLRLTFPGGNPQAKLFKEWLENNGVSFEVLLQGKTESELAGGTLDVF
ncbi:DUF1351 domain-containing protein [Streptococcus anginosus]|nr:DUF1351 domain-containing protein [Streptococcus anginosus]MED5825268.1 DUF1351 domain-containing protein [Streptococcus anginosus]MED5853086.1 DUF1351 domain-containing protein [Streptococcus anginosus]MED5896256.1 DUF1351 domain-containing protein [Streptococcus anginosus]MED5898317.1 DUF1351 domain-containing protein [Streptococcus anginosus]